jgi:hypothetical protein
MFASSTWPQKTKKLLGSEIQNDHLSCQEGWGPSHMGPVESDRVGSTHTRKAAQRATSQPQVLRELSASPGFRTAHVPGGEQQMVLRHSQTVPDNFTEVLSHMLNGVINELISSKTVCPNILNEERANLSC